MLKSTNSRTGWPCIVAATCLLLLLAPIVSAVVGPPDAQKTPADRIIPQNDAVHSVAFFPDGTRFVSACRDGSARVWDVASGGLIRTIAGHQGPVLSVAVSSDGAWIATGGRDHTVRVWDCKTWEQIAQLEGHTGDVRGVAFIAGGKLLSGGGDGLRIWDVGSEKLLWKWRGESSKSVLAMSVSADARRLALIDGYTASCIVFDLVNRKEIAHIGEHPFIPRYVAISPDGTNLFTDGPGSAVMRYDVDTGKQLPTPLAWRFFQAQSITYLPDGKRIAIGWTTAQVQIWDLESGELKQEMRLASNLTYGAPAVISLAVSPNGKTLVTGGGGIDQVKGWDGATENPIALYTLSDQWLKPKLGVARGVISWDEIPLSIKTVDGETLRFENYATRQHGGSMVSGPVIRQITDGLDAWLTRRAILLHRGGGLMEETLVDDNAIYQDLAWDGQVIWVGTSNSGITLLDTAGKTVDTLPMLPPCKQYLRLYALSPGKVLAIGVDGSQFGQITNSWCAILERKAGGIDTRVFFKTAGLATDWLVAPPAAKPGTAAPRNSAAPSAAFFPRWFTEPPAGSGSADRKIWIMAGTNNGAGLLVIDVNKLTATPANLPRSANFPDVPVPAPAFAPQWIDTHTCLYGGNEIYKLALHDKGFGPDATAVVLPFWNSYANCPLIALADRYLLPGETWYTIDRKTLAVSDLGRGLRVKGRTLLSGNYFISGCIGLAEFNPGGNCLYKISLDASHPLANRATADIPVVKKTFPGIADGRVVVDGEEVLFLGGDVLLAFNQQDGNGLGNQWLYNIARADEEEFNKVEKYRPLIWRLKAFKEERDRIGLTADQASRLMQLPDPPPYQNQSWLPADMKKYEVMFKAWHDAPDGPAKDKAAQPLLDLVVSQSRPIAKQNLEYNRLVEAVVSPSQLQRLEYKVLDAPQ